MTTESIPPGMRAELDRELSTAVDLLLARAAQFDGVDLVEANYEFTHFLLNLVSHEQLAVAAAALALRLRRGGA